MKVELDLSKFAYVKGSLANKALRIAINKAASPVKATVIAQAPAVKGNLKKSVKIKVKHYKANAVWTAIIGPSASFKRSGKMSKKGKNKGQKRVIRPARYAPIVEKKRGFLKSSLSASRNKFIQTLEVALTQQINVLLAKN